MGKARFINKKNSATFVIQARDTTDIAATEEGTSSDHVFVRVDRNPYSVPGIESADDSYNNDELIDDFIFADAEDDVDENDISGGRGGRKVELPDKLRKEIIELGFPDDGYNYLKHLRDIKNNGGGSSYYQNDKAQTKPLSLDVKAYDASRIKINPSISNENKEPDFVYNASKAAVVKKVQKTVDPDVARLLDDDDDLSRCGSDVEDLELEDDFVIKANLHADGEDETVKQKKSAQLLDVDDIFADTVEDDELETTPKARVSRPLDEQFDLLYQDYESSDGYGNEMHAEEEDESLAAKMGEALQIFGVETGPKITYYKVPKEDEEDGSNAALDKSTDVIQKCKEYGEMYCNESENDKDVVLFEESSDDSEVWDCETIVSTYSNLDNHPGKIEAPGKPKKRLPKIFPGETIPTGADVIVLRGRQKLPVDSTRKTVEKVKADKSSSNTDKVNRKLESKEEKKERKAAVKEEKREARKAKKELKYVYKTEAQKAQKVVAVALPTSVHLA